MFGHYFIAHCCPSICEKLRSSHLRCSVRRCVLRNSQESTCARVSFLKKLPLWATASEGCKK